MPNRIGDDAFAYYVSLGADRSYEQVAKFCGVGKRSVVRHAAKDRWTERLRKIEEDAKVRADARLATELEEMQVRHAKLLRGLAARAAKAIAEFPLRTAMEGAKAVEIVVKLERLIAGQASEKTHVSVESATRAEFERYLEPAKGSPEDDGEVDDGSDEW
jgi:hypothetical protein